MVDAIVGGVIMVVATTSLFLAIEVAEKAINSAGRYDLTLDEINTLTIADPNIDFEAFWSNKISTAPTYVDVDDGCPAGGEGEWLDAEC